MAALRETIDRLPPAAHVAVIRLRSLGDCVLSTPAIHLLRMYRPDLKIAVVVEERFADIYADVAKTISPVVRDLRTFSPELCLNLHGGTRSARLTALSGAKIRAGFDIFRPSWVYTHRLPTAQETLGVNRRVHTAEHAASGVFALGVPVSEVPRAQVSAPSGRSPHAPAKPYAVIHPLAASAEKTWPAENFCSLAARIEASGLEPVFIGAAGEDLTPFRKWRTVSGASIAEVARLSRDAALFVGNDSGPAHLAAAFGVPEVVLFGPSDAQVWAPWRTDCRILQRSPIASITVDEVFAALPRMAIQ